MSQIPYEFRDELEEIARHYNEDWQPNDTVVELPVALLREIFGYEEWNPQSVRLAVTRLRDWCQEWLDTGQWPSEV